MLRDCSSWQCLQWFGACSRLQLHLLQFQERFGGGGKLLQQSSDSVKLQFGLIKWKHRGKSAVERVLSLLHFSVVSAIARANCRSHTHMQLQHGDAIETTAAAAAAADGSLLLSRYMRSLKTCTNVRV